MIFIIDDDYEIIECISRFCGKPTRGFTNVIDAINALDDGLPELIFLDVLLDGPDGFTFLNEIASYSDTIRIPVVIITTLNLKHESLVSYNVIKILNKATMTPKDIQEVIENA